MERNQKKAVAFAIAITTLISSFGEWSTMSINAQEDSEPAVVDVIGNEYDDGVAWGEGYLLLQDGSFENGVNANTTLKFVDGEGYTREVDNLSPDGSAKFDRVYVQISANPYGFEVEQENQQWQSVDRVDNAPDTGYIAVAKGDKKALMDTDGNIVGNQFYDGIQWIDNTKYLAYSNGNKLLCDMQGNVLKQYSENLEFNFFEDMYLISDEEKGITDIYARCGGLLQTISQGAVQGVLTDAQLAFFSMNNGTTCVYGSDGALLSTLPEFVDLDHSCQTLDGTQLIATADYKNVIDIYGNEYYHIESSEAWNVNNYSAEYAYLLSDDKTQLKVARLSRTNADRTEITTIDFKQWYPAPQHTPSNIVVEENNGGFFIDYTSNVTGAMVVFQAVLYYRFEGNGTCTKVLQKEGYRWWHRNKNIFWTSKWNGTGNTYDKYDLNGNFIYSLNKMPQAVTDDMDYTYDSQTRECELRWGDGSLVNQRTYYMAKYLKPDGSSAYTSPYAINGRFQIADETGDFIMDGDGNVVIPSGECDTFVQCTNSEFIVGKDVSGEVHLYYSDGTEVNCESYDDLGTMYIDGYRVWGNRTEDSRFRQQISQTGMILTLKDGKYGVGHIGEIDIEQPETEYKITYNLNGGMNNSNNPTRYKESSGDITFLQPTRDGYEFLGWYTDSTYKNVITGISQGSKGNVTLYAKWQQTYTITYKLNGGKNNSSNPKQYTKTTETISLKNPARAGYVFKGWYSDSKYKNRVKQIAKGSSGNKTLYAKWSPIHYTIAFQGNGSTSGKMKKITNCTYGKSYTITKNAYSRKGHTFYRWYLLDNNSGKLYKNAAKVSNLTTKDGATVTLYAQWRQNQYSIVYNGNGNTSGTMSKQTCNYNRKYNLLPNKYKRKGYTFVGWNTKKNGTGKVYFKENQIKNLTSTANGKVTLYAQWKKNK